MRQSQLERHLLGLGESLGSQLPGAAHAHVVGMRQRAFAQFSQTGLPKITDEAWRYTNLRRFEKTAFRPSENLPAGLTPARLAPLEIDSFERYRIVLVDGWVDESLSTLNELPVGVECLRLKDALENGLDVAVIRQLDAQASHAAHGFAALNAALAADGIVLRVDAGTQLDKPIELLHVSRADANARLSNIIHLVSLGKGARADLVERYVSIGQSAHMTNASMTFTLAESAEVNHYRVQNESTRALHLGYSSVSQNRASRYRIFSFSMGALLDRHEVQQSLQGEKSHGEMKGLYVGRGRQHIDNYTTVVHASPGATSDEFYKGILNDRARAVFHGRIRVDPGAQQTDAQQQNRNLLLSTNAEADTKPQLEIYADDVKCAHGATVGYLDAEAIFYLRSRGLDESAARAILTEAFAAEIVDEVDLEPVREHLLGLLRTKLTDVYDDREAA